mgnify:CR=1 FL=1
MYVGIDPGINCIAIAILDLAGNVLTSHLFEADREKSQLDRMLENLNLIEKNWGGKDNKVAIEFTLARMGPSITSISQLGVCSGYLYSMMRSKGNESILVQPSQWQKKKGKEKNAEDLLEGLDIDTRKDVLKEASRYKKPLQHNIIDAFGIAFWRLDDDRRRAADRALQQRV